MASMRYRQFDHLKENPESIFRLFEQVYGDSRAIRQRWEWEFLRNPMSERIRFFVAESEGTLVGMTVRMPCDLRVGSDVHPAFFATNSMVAPVYRGQGLIRRLYQIASEDNALHLSKGTTPGLYRQLLSIGYREIVPNRYQVALLAPLTFFAGRFLGWRAKPATIATSIDLFTDFVSVQRFDKEHASLYPAAAIAPIRTLEWLNWRYCQVPIRRYKIFERRVRGRIVAWCVMRRAGAGAVLTDMRWDGTQRDEPGRTISFSKAWASHQGAIKLATWFGDAQLQRALGKKLFIKRRTTPQFSFFSLDRRWQEFAWKEVHFSHGDGDTDYL